TLPIGYIPGRLLIRFNKIMLSYTVIPNVTLLPKEDGFAYLNTWGAISIDGQTFEFPIYNYFKVAKSYTITVGEEATDITYRKLEMAYQKVLVPEPTLRVTNTYPSPNDTMVYPSTNYYIYFNSPIDSNSVSNNINFSPNVNGKWKTDSYDRRYIFFSPEVGFKANTWYEITLSTGIKDTSNNYLPSQTTLRFKTIPFKVTYTYPQNGQQTVYTGENISVIFSGYIDTSTVSNAFSITPFVNGTFNFHETYFWFSKYQNFLPNTTYTVTIKSSIRSMLGDTLAAPYVFSFKTASAGN
ncbi:MAG: Ig-like domain-containing protein, partial [Ignavibacteriales bacterium]|nr:Ig-like domain-containing protein [Ignavibacteriales bacterium]